MIQTTNRAKCAAGIFAMLLLIALPGVAAQTYRGAGLVFQGFGTIMGEHLAIRMLDEFFFRPAKGSVAN